MRKSTLKHASFNILIALSPCSLVHWRLISSRIALSVCCSPICTRVHPYLLTPTHTHICVCVDVCVWRCLCVCVRGCVCVCVCVCVCCVPLSLSLSLCISTNLRRRRNSARVIKSGRVSRVMPIILYLASSFVVCSSDRDRRGCPARCLLYYTCTNTHTHKHTHTQYRQRSARVRGELPDLCICMFEHTQTMYV